MEERVSELKGRELEFIQRSKRKNSDNSLKNLRENIKQMFTLYRSKEEKREKINRKIICRNNGSKLS